MKFKPKIVVHGGVGLSAKFYDGTQKAAESGYELLLKGKKAIDAVELAVSIMEDDPRFNAGTGSMLRLDGSIEMDAGIMDSMGNYGAVAGIKNVKNPIQVAKKVLGTPHHILSGEGALKFARKMGFKYYNPITNERKEKCIEMYRMLKTKKLPSRYRKWKNFDWEFLINKGCDTVGAVAMDRYGNFAVANSTGGTLFMLPGRVGDSALIGCGLYVGRNGAVCVTGIGEKIIKVMLSKTVYDKLNEFGSQKACNWGLKLFKKGIPIGVIALDKKDAGIASTRQMAWTSIIDQKVVNSVDKGRLKPSTAS